MNSGTTSLHLIVIKTIRLPEQLAFYTTLGLSFEQHRHGTGPLHYSTVSHPVFELYPLPKGVTAPDTTTRLGFTVVALDMLIGRLRDGGTSIIAEPAATEWGYTAMVKDLDGRTVELLEVNA